MMRTTVSAISSVLLSAMLLTVAVPNAGTARAARLLQHTPPRSLDLFLQFSTRLPGGSYDRAADVAVDRNGQAFVAVNTQSRDFGQTTRLSAVDAWLPRTQAFVTRVGADGTTTHWPIGEAALHAIAVDASGNVYVAGSRLGVGGTSLDAFIAKLASSGEVVYSLTFGGGADDFARSVAVDASGDVVVAGDTSSRDFPVLAPAQPCMTSASAGEVFVARFDRQGVVVGASCLGGSAVDSARGVAVDANGDVIVLGLTASSDFPVTRGAFQQRPGDGACRPGPVACGDAFVARLASGGPRIVWATYVGGSGADIPEGLAVDGAGDVYITGWTTSRDLPRRNAFQSECRTAYTATDCGDAFVVKLNATGSSLLFGTFLGGSAWETAAAVAVSSDGLIYVTGTTASADLLGRGSEAQNRKLDTDGFLTVLDPTGYARALRLIGDTTYDRLEGVAAGARNVVYVAGTTDLPTPPGGPLGFGDTDAYVARFGARRLILR